MVSSILQVFQYLTSPEVDTRGILRVGSPYVAAEVTESQKARDEADGVHIVGPPYGDLEVRESQKIRDEPDGVHKVGSPYVAAEVPESQKRSKGLGPCGGMMGGDGRVTCESLDSMTFGDKAPQGRLTPHGDAKTKTFSPKKSRICEVSSCLGCCLYRF